MNETLSRRHLLASGLALATASGSLSGQPKPRSDSVPEKPVHYWTLSDLARKIRAREVSPVEVTEQILARIEALEPRLLAFVTVTAERALDAARRAADEIVAGRIRGPLHGVPVAVKDLCSTRGVPTRGGSGALADYVPTRDATVVSRLEAAGAVLLGKLNTTEGAMVGYHPDFEIPRNPWGADRWPGVSSSGSGVATAAGMCYAALGTDTGGSIRYPSAANGLVGLKPTWGRVSRSGVLDLAPSLDHVGPMTRSVRDAAAMLQVLAGPDRDDPTTLHQPLPDLLTELDHGIEGLRLGYDDDYATAGLPPYLAQAIRSAVQRLEALGAELVDVEVPDLLPYLPAWNPICAAEAAHAHRATFPSRADDYGPWFRGWLEYGRTVTGTQYAAAHQQRLEVVGRLRPVFAGIDALACPSMVSEAFRYSPADGYGPFELDAPVVAGVPVWWFGSSTRFTLPYDFNGYPTLSLPCGATDDEGLPLSLQLVGRPLGESTLLRLGHAFEQATEWHDLHPPV